MNLFQKYGIKEVADVVFYSITRIDDEEFYTPVLYLDTLKVSNVEQTTDEVIERGGTTNRKVIGWNYNKDIKITLEDALFSPASMNFIWGGKFNSRLSLYTDTIARLNLANKYGDLSYSVKAKPSPELSDEAWELVYKHAQKTRTASGANSPIINKNQTTDWLYQVEGEDNSYIAENRYLLKKHYLERTYEEDAKSKLLTIVVQDFFPLKDNYTAILTIGKQTNLPVDDFLFDNIDVMGEIDLLGYLTINYKHGGSANYDVVLRFQFKRFISDIIVEHCYLYLPNEKDGHPSEDSDSIRPALKTENTFFHYFYDTDLKDYGNDVYEKAIIHAKNEMRKYQLYENVRAFNNIKRHKSAMPQKVIDSITDEINRLSRFSTLEHNIENKQCIDRIEKCVVSQERFYIDINQQKENFMKKLKDINDESYTIYYDYKTMLPLFHLKDDNVINFTENSSYFFYYDNRNIDNKKYYIHTYPEDQSELEHDVTNALKLEQPDIQKIISLYLQTYKIDRPLNWDSNSDDSDIHAFLSFCERINMLEVLDLSRPAYQPFITSLLKSLKYRHKRDIQLSDLKYLHIIWMPTDVIPQTNRNVNEFIQVVHDEETGVIRMAIAYWCLNYELKEDNVFFIKQGTPYYKWTRTVNKYDDYTLGHSITLDTNSFLGEYKIVGETYVRNQKTQKDQRYQITLNNVRLKIDNTLNLSADGDPTVFSIDAQVFNRKNQDMIELCQYNVEEDNTEGGYRIVPQKSRYTFTPTNQDFVEDVDIENNEIY